MTKLETLQLKLTATRVRMGVIEATHGAGCGHPGGSLSAADVLTYLYFREMRIDPEQPQDPNRDRFVLSKGHCAPGLYATLAERGSFPVASTTVEASASGAIGPPSTASAASPESSASAACTVSAFGCPEWFALVWASGQPIRRKTARTSGWSGTRNPASER